MGYSNYRLTRGVETIREKMKKVFALLIVLLLPTLCLSADPVVVGNVGAWRVILTKDAMTDKSSCFAIYEKQTNIQLSGPGLYISARGKGGIRTYQYRIDDLPGSRLIGAGGLERDTSLLSFKRADTGAANVFGSKRLRIQIFTVLDSILEYDIDMADVPAALALIDGSSCSQ